MLNVRGCIGALVPFAVFVDDEISIAKSEHNNKKQQRVSLLLAE